MTILRVNVTNVNHVASFSNSSKILYDILPFHSSSRSSFVIPTHLIGTIPDPDDELFTSANLRGGSQTRARPAALASNLPVRRIFISSTITRRKSLFSRGSRCRGSGWLLDPGNSCWRSGDGARLFLPFPRVRVYVCIGIMGGRGSLGECAARGSGSRAPSASVSIVWKSGDDKAGVGLR
jgi:hypothetical protein